MEQRNLYFAPQRASVSPTSGRVYLCNPPEQPTVFGAKLLSSSTRFRPKSFELIQLFDFESLYEEFR